MSENANEQTAQSPTAPKRRTKKAQSPEASAILALQQQISDLTARLNAAPIIDDKPGVIAQPDQIPGEIYEDGKDPSTGRPVYRKRRWSRTEIERRYEKVTFVPMASTTVKPHGVTRGWELQAGKAITAPSIVKDIYENSLAAVEGQTRNYPGFSSDQERAAFEATLKTKGPHFTPVKHVDYGWNPQALAAAAAIAKGAPAVEPSSVGHEPEVGFPGGYKGEALPEKNV